LLPAWLCSTEDPPFAAYLADVGLELVPEPASHPESGIVCQADPHQGLVVRKLPRHGPGERSGLELGDELLALDGVRLRQAEDFPPQLRADRCQRLLLARRGQVLELAFTSSAPAIERWKLRIDPQAPAGAEERRWRWLALEPEPAQRPDPETVRC
jgi:predicted metalloprotease with PDZ domain